MEYLTQKKKKKTMKHLTILLYCYMNSIKQTLCKRRISIFPLYLQKYHLIGSQREVSLCKKNKKHETKIFFFWLSGFS